MLVGSSRSATNGNNLLPVLDQQENKNGNGSLAGNSVPPIPHTLSVEGVAKASGAVAAIIYATGFLIDYTHSQRLGIGDGLGDLFRGKHMLVGALYWLLVVLIGIPSIAFVKIWLRNRQVNVSKSDGNKEPLIMTWAGLLTSLQLLGLLYVVTLVAPPGFVSRQAFWVGLNFGFSVLGLGRIYFLLRSLRSPATYEKKGVLWRLACSLSAYNWRFRRAVSYNPAGSWKTVRIMVLILTLVIDWRCLEAERLMPVILALLWKAKILIGIFIFMGHVAFQYWDRITRAIDPGDKRALWFICGAKLTLSFIFSVIGFAYSVYPFIPAERGGGNYTHASDVRLWIKSDAGETPETLIEQHKGNVSITRPLKLIEQTSVWVYVAPGPVPDIPADWKPEIVAVRKELVTSMKLISSDEPSR
jgi:hypothetical protein